MKIFKIWVVILAFVSSQLAWNLRPFVGDPTLAFELFRPRQGNFYVAVIQSVASLVDPKKNINKDTDKNTAKDPDKENSDKAQQ